MSESSLAKTGASMLLSLLLFSVSIDFPTASTPFAVFGLEFEFEFEFDEENRN